MSSGEAHTIWFPELKQLLKENWKTNLTIPKHFKLVADLDNKLNQIRAERKIHPPMMWCPNCKKRHRSKVRSISITAMYFALKKFDNCTEIEFKELIKNWKIYSKEKNLDIYGKEVDKTNKEQSTKA
ncbi:hypothetical protein LNP27_00995 [Flavobacterium galactosidilyticum]|uniref:hypothetical protein n=1 Tax=Flavobacterium galactosidilyticum TaxID=2893886 RepID=UPI001E4767C3|nr:hypothetical protein [Flavobacterium sp. F-340]UFH46601.1 hypothetical protein LNP27_00815 [Flavobacterium sp. F-340]UFH46611.1 hypothetical protein LNP27_00865 [Flavobacterium sp. F-340]UFH46636.1 hypothetical protein LNP27_00995 [Flavobacterium sp. F-340]